MSEDYRTLFEVDFSKVEQAAEALERLQQELKGRPVEDIMEEIVETVFASVDALAPRWKGDLVSHIDTEVETDQEAVYGMIYSDYDPPTPQIERGTDPYWPNIDNLEEWAQDHGLSGYLVARAIASKGIQAQNFFEEALRENSSLIYGLLDNAVAQVLENWVELDE